VACVMAYQLDTLDGLGSVLASSPESIKNENIGEAEMARESNPNLLGCADLTGRSIWLSSTYSDWLSLDG
jgi:hypothetical protein